MKGLDILVFYPVDRVFRPSKKLGQVFLIDKNILKKIEKKIKEKEPPFLEIGGGIGNLTEILALYGKVLTIEKDGRLVKILKKKFENFKNVEIVEGDALFILKKINLRNWTVVGNIPYNITTPLLKLILDRKDLPKNILLMVQKEVGERILEKDGKSSFLSIFVSFLAIPKFIFKVSRNSFFPRPEVDSFLIEIEPKKDFPKKLKKDFLKVIKIGYYFKRKILLNNFSKFVRLEKEKLRELLFPFSEKRAEDLSLKDWIFLTEKLKKGNFLVKLKI